MDEVLARRLAGLLTLGLAAFLLSWLLPRPGLERLEGSEERVVTMDLTRADSLPEEVLRAEDIVYAEDEQPTGPATGDIPEVSVGQAEESVAEATAAAVMAESEVPVISAPVPVPKPEAEPKPEPKPEATAPPKPKPEVKPEPKPAAAKPVVKPPTAATPAPATGGKVMVQAGAYSHLDKAEDARARSKALGVGCVISPGETAKGTLYRVRCGPYPSRDAAEAVVKKLSAASIPAAVVSGG